MAPADGGREGTVVLLGQVDGVDAQALAAAVVVLDHADVGEAEGLGHAELAAGRFEGDRAGGADLGKAEGEN